MYGIHLVIDSLPVCICVENIGIINDDLFAVFLTLTNLLLAFTTATFVSFLGKDPADIGYNICTGLYPSDSLQLEKDKQSFILKLRRNGILQLEEAILPRDPIGIVDQTAILVTITTHLAIIVHSNRHFFVKQHLRAAVNVVHSSACRWCLQVVCGDAGSWMTTNTCQSLPLPGRTISTRLYIERALIDPLVGSMSCITDKRELAPGGRRPSEVLVCLLDRCS